MSAGQRSKDQKTKLREYFLAHDAPEPLRAAFANRQRAEARKEDLDWTVPSTMVMDEMDKPRDTFILARGDYRNQTEKVTPGVPGAAAAAAEAICRPIAWDSPSGWSAPTNPLTARVAVNRYWQMYFGTGIVKTAEDFGSQGEAPSPSRVARLAGYGIHPHRLGCEALCSG